MRSWRAVFVLGFFCVSTSLLAQNSEGQAEAQRIATIAFNGAVMQTAEARRDFGALQSRFAPRQSQMQALNTEVETLRKQLANTANALSDQERESREQALSVKEKDLQRQAEDYRNDTESASQQAFQKVAQKFYSFVQTYAKGRGFTMVIERGTDAAPVVWYAVDNADITTDAVKAYDAQAALAAPHISQTPVPSTPTPH